MTTPAKQSDKSAPAILEQVIMRGDLSDLNEEQRLLHYREVCKSLGLNPLTRPFEYLQLQGKQTLYARKDATDQLRKLNGISIDIISEKYDRGMLSVHVRATDKTGRSDEDYGVVPWSEKMAPEFAANIKMKAVTKAKRRVTLSISGLGWLDETEVDDIPQSERIAAPKHREPESGPNMTRSEAIDLSTKLLRTLHDEKSKERKQLAVDLCDSEMRRMHRDQTEVYDRLIKAIDKEMAEESDA